MSDNEWRYGNSQGMDRMAFDAARMGARRIARTWTRQHLDRGADGPRVELRVPGTAIRRLAGSEAMVRGNMALEEGGERRPAAPTISLSAGESGVPFPPDLSESQRASKSQLRRP